MIKLLVRKTAVLLMTLAFVVGASLTCFNGAIALPLNARVVAYDSEQMNYSTLRESPEDNVQPAQKADDAENGLKGAIDNVREKLNLDQPIAPETKEFLGDVKEKAEEVTPGGAAKRSQH